MYQKGKSYEEINIGDKASFAKTITETDVYLFAGISGDFNPLHVDEEYARGTEFKKRIAHGGLAASLVALEITQKFRSPVYFGDTVTITATVTKKIERMKLVEMSLLWTNQRGDVVSKGSCKVIPPRKEMQII